MKIFGTFALIVGVPDDLRAELMVSTLRRATIELAVLAIANWLC